MRGDTHNACARAATHAWVAGCPPDFMKVGVARALTCVDIGMTRRIAPHLPGNDRSHAGEVHEVFGSGGFERGNSERRA